MGKEARKWAKRQRTGGMMTKCALLLLADYADDETGLAWPSIRTLVDEADTDTRCMRRQLDALESLGLIEKESGDRSRANRYRLRFDVEIAERPKRPQRAKVRVTSPQGGEGSQPTDVRATSPQQGEGYQPTGWGLGSKNVRAANPQNGKEPKEQVVSNTRARGSRELADALNATARSAEVIKLVHRWASGHAEPLPRTTYDRLIRQVQELRDSSTRPAYVWAALKEWDEKLAMGERPRPGLLRHLHDQIKLDGLTVSQMYATPVDYLGDEDIDVFEVLGYDPVQVEAPSEIENGPMDARRAWYDQARAERRKIRCVEARERIARRQQLQLLPRPA